MGQGEADVDVECLVGAMDRETALLEVFAREQESLLGSVRVRSWTELESRLARLRRLETRIQVAERERLGALPEDSRDADGFLAAVAAMEPEARARLERSYHALNLAVLRVKGSVSRLDHYVGTVMGALGTLLSELLPHRKGRIYSDRGAERQAPALPIVVDRNV